MGASPAAPAQAHPLLLPDPVDRLPGPTFHRQPQECASSGRFGPRARGGLLLPPVPTSIFPSHLGSHPRGQLSDESLI